MEIGEELIYHAERLAGVEQNCSFVFSRGYSGAAAGSRWFFGGVFQGANHRGADGEDWSRFAFRLRDRLRGGFGDFVGFQVDFVVFEALRAHWLERAEAYVESYFGDF